MAKKAKGTPVLAGILLGLNLALYVAIVGISSWAINGILDSNGEVQGTDATFGLIPYALLAGIVGVASVFVGFLLLKSWSAEIVAASIAMAILAFLFSMLALGFASKDIHVTSETESTESAQLKCLDGLVIVVAATQLLFVGLLGAYYI